MDIRNRWRRGSSACMAQPESTNTKKVKTGAHLLCCLAAALAAAGVWLARGGSLQYCQHADAQCNNGYNSSRVQPAPRPSGWLPAEEAAIFRVRACAWAWAQRWAARLWAVCPALPLPQHLPLIGMLLAPLVLQLIHADRATAVCVCALLGVCALTPEGVGGAAGGVEAVKDGVRAGATALAATTWNALIADIHLYDTLAHYAAKYGSGAGAMLAALCLSATLLGACASCGDASVGLLLTPLAIRVMEQLLCDPRPVLVAISVLASLGSGLLSRCDTFGRLLADQLGAQVDGRAVPEAAAALLLSCVCAYFAVIFLLFKPHQYKKDYRTVQLEHELSLWRRLSQTHTYTHAHTLQRAVQRECARLQRALAQPNTQIDIHIDVFTQRGVLEKGALLLCVCAAGCVCVCTALLHLAGAGEQCVCALLLVGVWMAALSSRSGVPSSSLLARIDLAAPLCMLAQYFYGFVLIKLRFPEALVQGIYWLHAQDTEQIIGDHTSATFLMVLVASAALGGGAARPLAASVRQLVHCSPAPAIVRAATLAHAIGSAVSVLSPAALCVYAVAAPQGYTPSARTHACLLLPLTALLAAVSWLLVRAHY